MERSSKANGTDFNGLSHMAGLGHVIISIGLRLVYDFAQKSLLNR